MLDFKNRPPPAEFVLLPEDFTYKSFVFTRGSKNTNDRSCHELTNEERNALVRKQSKRSNSSSNYLGVQSDRQRKLLSISKKIGDRISEVKLPQKAKHVEHRQKCRDDKMSRFAPQALPTSRYTFNPVNFSIGGNVHRFVAQKASGLLVDYCKEYGEKLLEDCLLLVVHMLRAQNHGDRVLAIITFAKLRCTGSLVRSFSSTLVEYFKYLFPSETELEVQGVEDVFAFLRNSLDNFSEVRSSPLFVKLYRFLMYCLSFSLFEKIGVTFSFLRYTKIESEALKRKYHMGVDFVYTMIDTILFLCERGYQCMVTGTLDPLYHSGDQYAKWFDSCCILKRHSKFLSNPETHGFNYFSFIADLDIAIEKGDAIYKHAVRIGQIEKTLVSKELNDLKMIKATEMTKAAAAETRKAPFSVLVYGGSSVGKSSFTDLLFYYYGKLFDLPVDKKFCFTVNPTANFWDNFNSSMWAIKMDDIAFLNPNVASAGGDPSVMSLIQVINNVPFVPDQADLCDKGKTPVRSRFVIATTNTEHLNSICYFSCPLAIQRRLPWIIDIQPKPEYIKDSVFLNGDKVPPVAVGCFPDYWIITIKRVVPAHDSRVNQRANLEVVHVFQDIGLFLKWFSGAARDFEAVQEKTMCCDVAMSSVELCKVCDMPKYLCECEILLPQAIPEVISEAFSYPLRWWRDSNPISVEPDLDGDFVDDEDLNGSCMSFWSMLKHNLYENSVSSTIVMAFTLMCVEFYLRSSIVRYVYNRVWGAAHLLSCMYSLRQSTQRVRTLFSAMGNKVNDKIGVCYLLVGVATLCVSGFIAWRSVSCISEMLSPQTVVGSRPDVKKDEKNNVWYKDEYVTTPFDVSTRTMSYNGVSSEQLSRLISPNCVFFRVISNNGKPMSIPVRAVAVSSHVYMTNNHSMPKEGVFELDIVSACAVDGVNPNTRTLVSQSQIVRYPLEDLAFVLINCLPTRKDISSLFCKESLSGSFHGYYFAQNENGTMMRKPVHQISLKKQQHHEVLGSCVDSWFSTVDEPTVNGDCGSLLIATSAFGPVILGIHYLGSGKVAGAIRVTYERVVEAMLQFAQYDVQPSLPMLSSRNVKRDLVSLHHKSPVRFTETGTANVYGTLTGPVSFPKSNVVDSVLRESLEKKGFRTSCVAPELGGWKPWFNNLASMTSISNNMDTQALTACKDAFVSEILSNLSVESLNELMIYDIFTAVNGAPGVKFVDKLNRHTSAGAPFRKSKKFYLRALPAVGELLDPVEFEDEIVERIEDCLDAYSQGICWHPVFTGSLKDEPTAQKKVDICKYRLFAGAPADWCVVVRMYLLSFTRVVQLNRFIFESAPGTVAQSLSWEQIKDFLCVFGKDRIVAGDYKNFDKSMCADIIFAAFAVIIDIHRAASWPIEGLRAIQCIAEDVAFAFMDFHGDLIQFFGQNPSGQPLTVIINGLVNSLYMRYAYSKVVDLSKFPLSEFQQNVHLMTYGDDNVMGIDSKMGGVFNHTTIQRALAEINVTYTMAEKDAATCPFICIDDVSFLKRRWQWDSDVGAEMCPLEEASIIKSLMINVASKTITKEEQAIAVVSSAVREYFYYGREIFEDRVTLLREVVHECKLDHYVEVSTFPSWSQLKKEFWKNSEGIYTLTSPKTGY